MRRISAGRDGAERAPRAGIMKSTRTTEIVAGELLAVHSLLGVIAVALREERTRRFVAPLAPRSQPLARALLAARARGATVALRVRGAELLDLVAAEDRVALAA